MKRLAIAAGLLFLISGGLAKGKDFDNTTRALAFLAEKPRCKTVRCLNRRLNRVEFLVRDLFKAEFRCTAISDSVDSSGLPVLVHTC